MHRLQDDVLLSASGKSIPPSETMYAGSNPARIAKFFKVKADDVLVVGHRETGNAIAEPELRTQNQVQVTSDKEC